MPKSEQKKLLVRLVTLVVVEEGEEEFKLSPEWEAELDRREELIEKGETTFYSMEEILSDNNGKFELSPEWEAEIEM